MAGIDDTLCKHIGDESEHGSADGGSLKRPEQRSRSGRRRQRTIRFRLACLVLACVLPVCLIAGFLVYYSYQHKRRAVESSVVETARALSLVIDREFANMQACVTTLATSPSLATGDLSSFHRQAQLVLRDYQGSDIILADSTGQQLVNSFVPFGKPLPRRNVPAAVRGIYATGKPVISNLFKGAVTGRLLLSVDVPVFRGDRVVYDLALTAPAEHLLLVLSQQRISPQWTISIFDRNFVMAARTRFPERYVGMQGNPALLKRLTETSEGSVDIVNKEGVEILAIFSRSATTGWTVTIGIPKALFIADIWQSLKWAVCGIALLSITGIGLALFLARRIAGSINALIAPALALGSGEPVDISQLDLAETNKVGQSLVRASELLQQRTAERERAEAARRQAEELERSNAELKQREQDALAHTAELLAIIADRKRAEDESRASEERLRLMGDNLPYSIVYQYTHEPDGTPRFLYVSAGVERLNGVKAEEVLNDAGVLHRQFLAEELPALLEAEMSSARDLSVFEREVQMRLPDGRIRWMHLRSRPRRLPDGGTVWDGVQTDITERKLAEEALREQAELLDLAHDTIMVRNLDGTIRFWNHGAEEMYGYSKEQATGKISYNLLWTVFPKPLAEIEADLLQEGRWEGELIQTAQGGTRIVVDGRWVLQRDKNGQACGVMEINNDITDRKRAEENLRQSEHRFSSLAEATFEGIVITEAGRIVEANEQLARMLGYELQEIIGRDVSSFIFPEDRDRVLANILQAKESWTEHRMHRKDGSVIVVAAHGRPSTYQNSAVRLTALRDITERKRVEEALRESEERFRSMYEKAAVGIQQLANDGRLLMVNAALCRMLGYDESELLGRDVLDLTHPDDLARDNAVRGPTIRGERDWHEIEKRYIHRDGSPVWVHITSSVVKDGSGHPLYRVAIVQDITERKRAEEALLRAEKLASVGRMASTIAHEINNPLETIGHAVYLALTDPETSPKAKSYLELAVQELERVTHITKQTLAFHRVDKTPTLIDLRASVDSILKLFAPRLQARGITVVKRYAEVECIRAGGGEIQQVISNLLSNSMDAVPNHGKIQFRVSRSVGRNGSRLIRFTIADTGSGIPPERLKNIFEPFFTTKEVVGTGLGLWVSKQIVDKHGAKIRVRSKVGKGTVFSIVFPIAEGTT